MFFYMTCIIEVMILILLAAAGISAVLQEYIDAAVIFVKVPFFRKRPSATMA